MDFKITVGILSQLKSQGDYQGFKYFQPVFPALRQALEEGALPVYQEPAHLRKAWSAWMDCSSIHYLRRLAAHIALADCLPEETGKINPMNDPYYLQYLETLGLAALRYRFDHLFFHSDCSGFYLPVDFEEVLFPELGLNIPGDMIGSSYRLRDECIRIAEWLGLPLDYKLTPEELNHRLENCADGNILKKFALEAYVCFILFQASIASIELGAAIVFHEPGGRQEAGGRRRTLKEIGAVG